MLSEVAAEILRFLSRRDLDKATAINKWLDAMIAKCFDVYPLRPVTKVEILPSEISSSLEVSIEQRTSANGYSFSSIDEAVNFVASILRHSYVERLWSGSDMISDFILALLPVHWTTLVDAIRTSSVQWLAFNHVDFSALDANAFLDAMSCRGLRAYQSVVPSGFVMDVLIRSSIATGLHQIYFYVDEWRAPLNVSDNAVLEFFFPAQATPREQPLDLSLVGSGITGTFLTKFFERLRSSAAQPGSFIFCGAAQQRGLSAYDRYLAPVEMQGVRTTYHFPSIGDDSKFYAVSFYGDSSYMDLNFGLVRRSS